MASFEAKASNLLGALIKGSLVRSEIIVATLLE
jgi:hypothetical protein